MRGANDILSRAVNNAVGIIREADKGMKEVVVIRDDSSVEVTEEGVSPKDALRDAVNEYRKACEELVQLAEFLGHGFKEVARVYGGNAWTVAPEWDALDAGEFSWQLGGEGRAVPLAPLRAH